VGAGQDAPQGEGGAWGGGAPRGLVDLRDHPMGLGTPKLGKGTPNGSEDHHDGGDHPTGTTMIMETTPWGHPMGLGTTQCGWGPPSWERGHPTGLRTTMMVGTTQ